MNSVITAKALTDRHTYAGRKWYYDFRALPDRFDESVCCKQAQAMAARYAKICKRWDQRKNSEWICRLFLSGKMILAASIQLTSRRFANTSNLQIVRPYLSYYAILSLMRAIVFTLPEQEWDDGRIIKLSHRKLANLVVDHISQFERDFSKELGRAIDSARAARELISYWHPSGGPEHLDLDEDPTEICTLMADIAQFNSEIMESSVYKHNKGTRFGINESYIEQLVQTELYGVNFTDFEDAYRIDYLSRKYPYPANIQHTMTEGHVESFFGSWMDAEGRDSVYSPDDDWRIIFDFL